jgi:hypothetical protein
MPYIKQQRRGILAGASEYGRLAESTGELNYSLTMVVIGYLKQRGLTYGTINDIVGALEGAKLEFVRRVAGPYENRKIVANGDVYDLGWGLDGEGVS